MAAIEKEILLKTKNEYEIEIDFREAGSVRFLHYKPFDFLDFLYV